MANARKRKARIARRAVNRGDRIKATPETLAKLKPHPLELLLARGREDGGIDADQLQCCEEIADAAQATTRGLGVAQADLIMGGFHCGGQMELSSHEERLTAIWFAWAFELARRFRVRPFVVVELIAEIDPRDARRVSLLCGALDLWAKVRREMDRATRGHSPERLNTA